MVLCEIVEPFNLPAIWLIIYSLGFVFVNGLSATFFYFLYWNPSYELWKKKSNPAYPPASKVREEIFQMNKGLVIAAFPPALSLWLSRSGISKGYCGFSEHTVLQHVGYQVFYFILLDFIEFFYHYGTHVSKRLWQLHKYHHQFFNPTPFAVIADEVADQLVRALPMAIFPYFFPINLDLMFIEMAVVIYGYGTYLHCGYELDYPDAHHPILNTSFQHFLHHDRSIYRKPYHCGFVLNVFDHLFGSVYHGACFCCKCSAAKGERSLKAWEAVEKPNYSEMLTARFWKEALKVELAKLQNGELFRFF